MLAYCSLCVCNLFIRAGNRGRWPASVKLVSLPFLTFRGVSTCAYVRVSCVVLCRGTRSVFGRSQSSVIRAITCAPSSSAEVGCQSSLHHYLFYAFISFLADIGVASYGALGHVPPPRLPASYFGDHSLYRL